MRIHFSHMGVEKSKNRARDLIFWPGIGKAIEIAVEALGVCQVRRSIHPKEPLGVSHVTS